MTSDKGRGVFASKDLKRGELLVVEKSIADALNDNLLVDFGFTDSYSVHDGAHKEIVQKCFHLTSL